MSFGQRTQRGRIGTDHGSFGWVLGTDQEVLWEYKGIARGYPMNSYRAEGYGRISLLSFLTHYVRYLEIQTPDDFCISSHCDNYNLINSSSWYAKPDHDLLMTLSALRTNLPLRLASLHVRAHRDKLRLRSSLQTPDQLATEVNLTISVQLANLLNFTCCSLAELEKCSVA
jgi:hypothetical protein